MHKYLISTLLLLTLSLTGVTRLSAQNYLTVDTVYYDIRDLEAAANEKKDNLGNPYALVKIELPLQEVKVEETADITEVDYRTGEIWAYITASEDYGATEITIKHGNYYPLTVKFADWGIEPQGKRVYRIVVSLPTALFAEATRFYNNLKFSNADSLYRLAVTDASTTDIEKTVSAKRLESIDRAAKINTTASYYAQRYLKMRKAINAGEDVSRNDVLSTLDSCIFWYNLLAAETSIEKAVKTLEKFTEIRAEVQGTKIIEGNIVCFDILSGSVRQKKKTKKMKDVKATIVKDKDEEEIVVKTFDTDDNGNFALELSDVTTGKISFEYDGYKTEKPLPITGRDYKVRAILTKEQK